MRHEITGGGAWTSDDSTYDDYAVNGEALPTVFGKLAHSYWAADVAYRFFVTAIPEDSATPIALRRFYAHPTTISVNLAYTPEQAATYRYQNPSLNFSTETASEQRARSAGLGIEYAVKPATGVFVQLTSAQNEETSRTADTFAYESTGRDDEIRRAYEFGLSQYLFDHLNLKLAYAILDFESSGEERLWSAEHPLLATDYRYHTDTRGRKITLSGEYIYRKWLGLQAGYAFGKQEAEAKTVSFYANNFPDLDLRRHDDSDSSTLSAAASLYLGEKTVCRVGGSYAAQKIAQVYEADQQIDQDWRISTVEARIWHYLNRHWGVQLGYAFTARAADVVVWHPASASELRTTYQAETKIHTIYLGVTGRF